MLGFSPLSSEPISSLPVAAPPSGNTIITLNLALIAFSAKTEQNRTALTLALKAMSSWVPNALQTKTAINLALKTMASWLPKAVQPTTIINLATKAMASWVAQSITWANSAAGTVIDLTLASFSFLAKAPQNLIATTITLASLTFSAKALQIRTAISLALKTMASWSALAVQPTLAIGLALKTMTSWLPKTIQIATNVVLTKASLFLQAQVLSYIEGAIPAVVISLRRRLTRYRNVLKRRDY